MLADFIAFWKNIVNEEVYAAEILSPLKHMILLNFFYFADWIQFNLIEPRCEKTGFLHMRKQRRRSASR